MSLIHLYGTPPDAVQYNTYILYNALSFFHTYHTPHASTEAAWKTLLSLGNGNTCNLFCNIIFPILSSISSVNTPFPFFLLSFRSNRLTSCVGVRISLICCFFSCTCRSSSIFASIYSGSCLVLNTENLFLSSSITDVGIGGRNSVGTKVRASTSTRSVSAMVSSLISGSGLGNGMMRSGKPSTWRWKMGLPVSSSMG